MNSLHSSLRAPACLRPFHTLILALAGAALLFGISPSRLSADLSGLPPTIHFTQGLQGKQVCLRWVAQPGVQYVVQKSASLAVMGSPGGFATVALVTAESAACQWVDPEAAATKAFYRIEIPGPQVFALEPAVISTTGGDIFVRGQCLPAGSFLALEIPGQAPIFVPLVPVAGQPGLWRASVGGIAGGVVAGIVIAARVTDSDGTTVALVNQTIEVTETGYASDAPPWLPPAAPVPVAQSNPIPGIGIVVKRNPKKKYAHRATPGSDDDCDDMDDDASGLWLSRKGYQYYMAQSDMSSARAHINPAFKENSNSGSMVSAMAAGNGGEDDGDIPMSDSVARNSGMGRGKVSLQDFHFAVHRGLPGEVSAEQCDLALPCPAGPPLEWVRSYRSRAPVASGHGTGWDFSYNIYIEPVPLAAGVNAPVVLVHDGSGRTDKFVRQGDGSYRCNGMFREGRFNPDTSFTLTFADKGAWIFCRLVGAPWSGRIGSIADRNGVALNFTYNNGQLATVSDAFGHSLSVTWGPTGQISSVADSTGRSVSYSYFGGEPGGSAGDLKSVSCPQEGGLPPVSGPTTYTYTSGSADDRLNHNLTSATDGAGRNLGAFTYSLSANPAELEFDAVASVRKGQELLGNVKNIKIPTSVSDDDLQAYVIYENDELGRVTETTCDRMHRPTSVREYTGFATPGAPVTATTNRPTGKLRAADPDFYQTTCLYNGQHLPTRVTMPDGVQERTTYEYDLKPACPLRERANPRVCTLVSPAGEQRTISMEYLPGFGSAEPGLNGLPPGEPIIRRIGLNGLPPGQPVIRGISLNGLPPGQPVMGGIWDGGDGDGGCTESARGVDRDGKDCTNHGHHKLGAAKIGPKQKAWLCANFRVSLRTSLGQQFSWGYDASGNRTSSRSPIAGAGCDIAYNTLGQVTSVRTLNGPGSTFIDECVYDADSGFCISFISDSPGLHLTTSCARDALGRVTSITDPRGFDTLFTYNPLDQCVTVQSPPVGNGAAARITTTYFYDAGGLPSGCDIEHRDATGALVAANPAYSTRILRESPSRPRLVSRVAVENRPVALPAGSTDIASVGLANFDVCDFLFDAAGQCIQESTPAVCRAQPTDSVTSYQYDERRLLHRCIDGQQGAPDAVTTTTECDYTPAGDLSRCATLAASGGLPGAVNPTVTFTYDGFRRCTFSTDPMGNVETFSYDNQGYVTCSLFGELDDQPGSGENVLLSRVKVKFHWDCSSEERKARPAVGRPILQGITSRWTPLVPKPHDSAFFDVFTKDETMTVDRFTATSSAQEVTTVNRSPAGFVMSISTNGDTLESNTYDTARRLLSCANGACSVAYTLDACGNVLSLTRTDFPSGGGSPAVNLVRLATYDALGRAVQMSERANVSAYQYDSLSRETCFQPPVGAPVYSNYDGTDASGPYSVQTQCDVDGNGSPETLGSSYARACPKRYKIKIDIGPPRPPIFGRSVTNSNGHTTTFTLDSRDHCVQTDFPDGTQQFRQFDSLGRLVSDSRQDGATFISEYNLNGAATSIYTGPCRPPYLCDYIAVAATSLHYNGRGDCTRLTQGTSDVIRSFDSCGNMVSESQNGHIVQHTYTHRGRASTTYPSGARYNETRNAQGLLLSVAAEGAAGTPVAAIQYLGYRPAQETRANGVVTSYGYRGINDPPIQGTGPDFSVDACVQSLVTGPTGTVLSRSFFSRDANQQLIRRETIFGEGPNTSAPLRRQLITRDRLNRLTRMVTGARRNAGTAIALESDVTYTLDLEGQRLSATGGSHPGAYSSNDLNPPGDRQMNQYSSWPGGPLEWGDNGSLTLLSDGTTGTKHFVYDAYSRLVSVVDPNTGVALASYSYDACDRLVSRTIPNIIAALPPVITFFIYDGDACIQELNELGEPQMTFAAMGLCIIPINGDPIYPHGSSAFLARSIRAGHYAVSNFHIEVDGASGGYLSSFQPPSYEVEDVSQCLTTGIGAVLERFDFDDGGQPIFLTSDGVVRQGASSSLSGFRWLAPECIWSPESGLFNCPGGTYSPALGQEVSAKTKPKERKKEYVGHVTLMK